jgi:hypothetical protein
MALVLRLSGSAAEVGVLSVDLYQKPGYSKLPGARRGVFTRSAAWAANDHILLIEGSRASERYKRVYFRDVQALTIMRRNRFVIEAPWLFVPPVLAIAAVSLPPAWRATGWLMVALIVAAILVYLYVAAFFYGCNLYIATAVGNVLVKSIFREWQARRFHEKVTPLVMAVQQTAPPLGNP